MKTCKNIKNMKTCKNIKKTLEKGFFIKNLFS